MVKRFISSAKIKQRNKWAHSEDRERERQRKTYTVKQQPQQHHHRWQVNTKKNEEANHLITMDVYAWAFSHELPRFHLTFNRSAHSKCDYFSFTRSLSVYVFTLHRSVSNALVFSYSTLSTYSHFISRPLIKFMLILNATLYTLYNRIEII